MFDNPIIVILVIAAALLRWLWEKSRADNQDPERPTVPGKPIPRSDETQSEEERIRRFMEALGQPTTSPPPPKVTPKRTIFPQPTLNPLPPLKTVPPPLPPPIWAQPILIEAAAPRPVETPEEEIFTPAPVQEIGFEVRDLDAQTSGGLTPAALEQQGYLLKLRSAQGLRDAIILREIFGPPRSLQALETAL